MLERDMKRNTMARRKDLVGAKLTVTKTVELSFNELLDFIQENWLDIPLVRRDKFKQETMCLELGIKKPPKHEEEEDEESYF